MFSNLKTLNPRKNEYRNMPDKKGSQGLHSFHISPGATTAVIKTNDGDRLVRCRVCGFPCDKERDAQGKEGSWAGTGISYGEQQTAGSSIGDVQNSDAGYVVDYLLDAEGNYVLDEDGNRIDVGFNQQSGTIGDRYYNRTIVAGCPSCGTLNYAD